MLRREIRRSFCQELAFRFELAVLPLQLAQPRPLRDVQRRFFLRVFGAVRLHPVPESDLVHTDLASHMGDRARGIDHHLGGFFLELRRILLTFSWHPILSFPVEILLDPLSGKLGAPHPPSAWRLVAHRVGSAAMQTWLPRVWSPRVVMAVAQSVAMACWAAASVTSWPQTAVLSWFSMGSLALGLAPGSGQRLCGSVGAPPS